MAEQKVNPANAPSDEERKIIPMTLPMQTLEVPEIPGFVLYWMEDRPGRIHRAMQAGYTFVDPGEVKVNQKTLGANPVESGSTDMGSRVSVASGGDATSNGQPMRLYLMKIKKEHYALGQKILEDRNESIAAALRGGNIGMDDPRGNVDPEMRYLGKRTKIPDFYKRKVKR